MVEAVGHNMYSEGFCNVIVIQQNLKLLEAGSVSIHGQRVCNIWDPAKVLEISTEHDDKQQ